MVTRIFLTAALLLATRSLQTKATQDVLRSDKIVSTEEFVKFVSALNFPHPEILHAQAVLESNGFSSRLAKTNNNLFGMKHPRVRINSSIRSVNGFAYYDHWSHSVLDYVLWYVHSNEPGVDYYEILRRKYAEDHLYVSKVKALASTYEHYYQ